MKLLTINEMIQMAEDIELEDAVRDPERSMQHSCLIDALNELKKYRGESKDIPSYDELALRNEDLETEIDKAQRDIEEHEEEIYGLKETIAELERDLDDQRAM